MCAAGRSIDGGQGIGRPNTRHLSFELGLDRLQSGFIDAA